MRPTSLTIYNNIICHHPHDSQAAPAAREVIKTSSAGQHMAINTLGWVDPRNPEDPLGPRSSQWGTQFDKPNHFIAGGEIVFDTSVVSGPAIVLDIRTQLEASGDPMEITAEVIRTALAELFKKVDPDKEANKPHFARVLLRTLSDEQANSQVALENFPYFLNQEAVFALIDGIKESTGQAVLALFNEPPSVDEVNQGHLACCNPETNLGGAHGALHDRGVLIGENFDFRNFPNGTLGYAMVHFDPNWINVSPDSALVSNAYFVPTEKVVEVNRALFGV